ncbi:HNH endonuclease signature motif containing protein [Comamonas sp. 4034]|uniref:HNH endonuclease signature motif containing protein n=1 Tax=Comamonas sp. 4034 TaxID=3156455 RepID=UPI003D19D9B3
MTRRISGDQLRAWGTYDPETGIFTRHKGGAISVALTSAGYVRFSVLGSQQYAQRMAVLYMTDVLPGDEFEVDHINGDKSDNRWSNLRVVSLSENQHNRRRPNRRNKSGYLGVSQYGSRYRAQIWWKGKIHRIGVFKCPQEASRAYFSAKQRLAGDLVVL